MNLGKSQSSEPFYMLSAVGGVDELTKSSSFPSRGDFKRPTWAPDFDGAMMAKLLATADDDGFKAGVKPPPCKTCPAAIAAAAASPKMSKTKQVAAIMVGALVGIVVLAIVGVVVYEVMRRRRAAAA